MHPIYTELVYARLEEMTKEEEEEEKTEETAERQTTRKRITYASARCWGHNKARGLSKNWKEPF